MDLDKVMTAIEIACAVVTAASAIVAMTPTPAPNTTWGKVYRMIETLGLVVGKAKQNGIVPSNPTIDKAEKSVEDAAREVMGPPKS